ncbi:MAG TPA: GAF domain-containing protein, partial [Herpetosiphonaceae bacterium]
VAARYPAAAAPEPAAGAAQGADPLAARALESRQLVFAQDLKQAGLSREQLKAYSQRGARSALLLPLVCGDRAIGLLALEAEQPRSLEPGELLVAQLAAGQLAIAIQNLQLQENTARRDQEVATLNDIAATVSSTLDPRQVYRLVVQKINEYFQVEAGSLWLEVEQTTELECVMTLEAGEEKLAGVRVPPGQGFVGEAMRSHQAVVVPDVQNDPRHYKKVSEDVGLVITDLLCVPMLVKGNPIGVIQLINKLEGQFNNDDATRLSTMASTIAVAIENARLFQKIAENRNRLEAILNSTEDAILTIDMAGVVVTANPMIEKLFGLPWDSLPGQAGAEILAQIDSRTQPLNQNYDAASAEIAELELLKPLSGTVRRVLLPVYSSNEEKIGQLIVFHDISEERELARIRDDYTGMLVHDLRAPLTGIMNGIRMVSRGFAGPINEQQRELLDLANNSSNTMVGMINTLLDISKMEAGEMNLDRTPCSVYDIVEQARDRVITSAQSANIGLDLDLEIGLPIIEVDRDKLVRVLQNLLDNAIKFTPLNGNVRVKVRNADGDGEPSLVWNVIDTGPGIPEAYRARIFEKFGQVKGQKVKGTGLGLAFAKLTTEAHGGQIWVDSIEGQGSTFSFTTPYKSA